MIIFKKLEPDIVVIAMEIKKKFLNLSKQGFINAHAIMPKWEGQLHSKIYNEFRFQTGISIMKIVEELDAGLMHQDKIQINENVDTLTSIESFI